MEMMDVGSSIGKNVGPLFPTNTNPGDLHEFSSHFGPVEFAKRTNLFGGVLPSPKPPGASQQAKLFTSKLQMNNATRNHHQLSMFHHQLQ